jgi:hypothetical protein
MRRGCTEYSGIQSRYTECACCPWKCVAKPLSCVCDGCPNGTERPVWIFLCAWSCEDPASALIITSSKSKLLCVQHIMQQLDSRKEGQKGTLGQGSGAQVKHSTHGEEREQLRRTTREEKAKTWPCIRVACCGAVQEDQRFKNKAKKARRRNGLR